MATGKEAHFLHTPHALDAVLVAPVENPRAMSWVGTSEVLLVGGSDGVISSVEPAFGTRTLFRAVAEPVHLASHGDSLLILGRSGRLEKWNRNSRERVWGVNTGLVGNQGIRVSPTEIACIGDDAEARREVVLLSLDGTEQERMPTPARTALGVGDDGTFLLARSLDAGLLITPLGGLLNESGPPTAHALRFSPGGGVVGVASGGVAVWPGAGLAPQSVRLPDAVNAALHADGRTLAVGSRDGTVAIADIAGSPNARTRPPRLQAHEGPVRMLSFSRRGRWLATIGDQCRVWAY
jgi:hypothetical protein